MNKPVKSFLLILTTILLAGVAASCGGKTAGMDALSQTLTPMSAQVQSTITARAGESDKHDDLANAIATATVEAQKVYGTQTAVAALNEPARLATVTAMAPVVAELPRYGIDPSEGYVAWMHPPAKIDLKGLNQIGYANDFQSITASDFVMAADITWHTISSTSGCGFMFRSNGDTNKPSQYIVVISRVASGQMAFLGMSDGKLSNFHSFYPKSQDRSFSWFNDATNRLAIVARGKNVDVYTNGQLVTTVDVTTPPDLALRLPGMPELPPGATDAQKQDYANVQSQSDAAMSYLNAQLAQAMKNFTTTGALRSDGFLGFIGINQSGEMSCKFENGWLFQLVK